ncbi:hypothetical protein QQ054_35870 [Oscillatoria amoena NRMC-F 0135]|nr:hypothetical protein [Oscillatoria amoena NRMC-F 0135]
MPDVPLAFKYAKALATVLKEVGAFCVPFIGYVLPPTSWAFAAPNVSKKPSKKSEKSLALTPFLTCKPIIRFFWFK